MINDFIKVVDLKFKIVLFGFIDMYVYIESEISLIRYFEFFIFNEVDVVYNVVEIVNWILMVGFIMVWDLGGSGVNVFLWNVIVKGKIFGFWIFIVEKVIVIIGGYVDFISGWKKELMGDFGLVEGVINSFVEVWKVVR